MATLQNAVKILGEGPTEFFYFNSLKDEFPQLQNIEPKVPKHSSLEELRKNIETAVNEGYSKVFCVIDMDNKREPVEKEKYRQLREDYSSPVVDDKKGINCEVVFYETDRCSEFFFLLYFKLTTSEFRTSDDVEKELNKTCGYIKSIDFFKKHPLHPFFIKQKGSLKSAINNANNTCKTREKDARDYSYSELGKMMQDLGINPTK